MGIKQIKDFDLVTISEVTDKLLTQQSDGVTRAITIQQIIDTNATTTPTPNMIPKADSTGKIASGWMQLQKGKVWVSHGNNVITFPQAHSNNNYVWNVSLVQAPMGGITPRNVGHSRGLSLFVSNESPTRGKIRIEGGYGFTSGGHNGISSIGTTERFDDVANTHAVRASATARYLFAGYSLNGYGFTSCGYDGTSLLGTTERFDDITNTHTLRASATARSGSAGYSLNGYGFTSCGYNGSVAGTTERFDDITNTHTLRASAAPRDGSAGYSLNGYGFTSCGWDGANFFGMTERFDDVANTHTVRAAATARNAPAGYATNEYFVNYITIDA